MRTGLKYRLAMATIRTWFPVTRYKGEAIPDMLERQYMTGIKQGLWLLAAALAVAAAVQIAAPASAQTRPEWDTDYRTALTVTTEGKAPMVEWWPDPRSCGYAMPQAYYRALAANPDHNVKVTCSRNGVLTEPALTAQGISRGASISGEGETLSYPVPAYRDGWTAAAAQAAVSNCAIAAKRMGALPVEQIKALAVIPEADRSKPEGINNQAAEAFNQIRDLCAAILAAQARN